MRKSNFNKIKAENPESRIGQRRWEYQQVRDDLAKVLNSGDKEKEIHARINYLVEKTVSKEKLKKQDYDFILGLSTSDLNNFVSEMEGKVLRYRAAILTASEEYEYEPNEELVEKFFAGNKMLRFISQVRNDVSTKPIRALGWHTYVKMGEKGLKKRKDEMKSIYPNWEEMVAANEIDAKAQKEKLKQSRKNSLKDEKRKDVFEKIYGDKEAVIKDLKENFVNFEENAEMFGQKGKKVTFELPAVGDFKGFKSESFISDDTMNAKDLRKNPEVEKQLYLQKEICNLLNAVRKYMEENGVQLDGDGYIDYEKKLKHRRATDAGECLNKVLELNDDYWLQNKLLVGQEYDRDIVLKPHTILRCINDKCFFVNSKDPLNLRYLLESRLMGFGSSFGGTDDAKILIKLS